MSKPLVVTIPHRLGKEEAKRRLKDGLQRARTDYSKLMSVQEENWNEDRVAFRLSTFGQSAQGTIDVGEDQLRIEVQLPWLLGALAEKLQPLIRKEGTLLLEKK
jgi:hypothetical protein